MDVFLSHLGSTSIDQMGPRFKEPDGAGVVRVFDVLVGGVPEELGYERGARHRTLRHRATARRKQLGEETRRVARAVHERLGYIPRRVAERD